MAINIRLTPDSEVRTEKIRGNMPGRKGRCILDIPN